MKKKRLQQLMDLLRLRQNLECNEAAEYLGVSLPTVRRDFGWLADNGMVRRFHGGIALLEGGDTSVFPIALRRTLDIKVKEQLAALAARQLPSSGVIFIDSGTTTACLGPLLTNPNLYVISNSVSLLRKFSEMPEPHARFSMTGGDFHQSTDNFLGLETIRTISHYHADMSVISCTALDENFLYDAPEDAAAVQQAMFENSDSTLVMADSGKFGKHALYKSLPMEKVRKLVTDDAPDTRNILSAIRQKGVQLLLCPPCPVQETDN